MNNAHSADPVTALDDSRPQSMAARIAYPVRHTIACLVMFVFALGMLLWTIYRHPQQSLDDD